MWGGIFFHHISSNFRETFAKVSLQRHKRTKEKFRGVGTKVWSRPNRLRFTDKQPRGRVRYDHQPLTYTLSAPHAPSRASQGVLVTTAFNHALAASMAPTAPLTRHMSSKGRRAMGAPWLWLPELQNALSYNADGAEQLLISDGNAPASTGTW